MPNWAEGTIKLRGERQDIISALEEMFKNDDVVIKREKDNCDYVYMFFETKSYFYINGTRRAFIDSSKFDIMMEEDFGIIEIDKFQQAWAALPENYTEISKKHNIDIKIFTFEQGFQFTQEIEISNGEVIKDICKEYDNYEWDVPFAHMGG